MPRSRSNDKHPHGYTHYRPHGFHGYGYGAIKSIEDAIESFGAAKLALAETLLQAELAQKLDTVGTFKSISEDYTKSFNDGFTTTTENLIEGLVMKREDIETELADAC